jgi:argininosuccinate synthase
VRLKLYKGTVLVTGRASKTDSLFDPAISTSRMTVAPTTRRRRGIHPAERAAAADRGEIEEP